MEKTKLFEISRSNVEWLKENYGALKKEFDSRWIVIQNRKVVKSAGTFDEIMQAIKKYDKNEILVEFIQSEPIAMFF
jgi:sulfatase maturation enzyme AslB (radical SAM superfamily)